MKSLRSTLGVAAISALTITGLGMGNAHAGSPSAPQVDSPSSTVVPHIIGGTKAVSPWIVQLAYKRGSLTFGCTGQALSSEWILTARHCVDGVSRVVAFYSNSTTERGTMYEADKWVSSPNGDVGLVHLQEAHPISRYAKLADSYTVNVGDSGTIAGYGLRANQVKTDWLYKADVNVTGTTIDGYGGNAVEITGSTGAANHGDSGGPLIVNDAVVGICSRGEEADPGANINAMSRYSNITDHREWIKDTSGV